MILVAAACPIVAQEYLCPTISIECLSKDCCRSPLEFVAHVSNTSSTSVSYKWAISAGRIVKGQGTPSIKVVSKPGEIVTATLEVYGPDPKCPRVASITQAICDPPPPIRLFAQYESIWRVNEESHLDRFANQLHNEPGARGYIVIYGERSRGDDAKNYLVANGNIESDRIVVVNRKRLRSKVTIKLYVVPVGAYPPHG